MYCLLFASECGRSTSRLHTSLQCTAQSAWESTWPPTGSRCFARAQTARWNSSILERSSIYPSADRTPPASCMPQSAVRANETELFQVACSAALFPTVPPIQSLIFCIFEPTISCCTTKALGDLRIRQRLTVLHLQLR